MRNRHFFSLPLAFHPPFAFEDPRWWFLLLLFFFFSFLEAKLRWISSNTTTKGRVADHTRPVYRAPIPPSRLFATLVETSSIPALFLSPVNRDFSFGGNISRGRDGEEFTPELFEGGWTNCSPSLSPRFPTRPLWI